MIKAAICTDADHSILTRDHPDLLLQTRDFNEEQIKTFWEEVDIKAEEYKHKTPIRRTNTDCYYIRHMLDHPAFQKRPLTMQEVHKIARQGLPSILCPGMPYFFQRKKQEHPNLQLSSHIISLGIVDMLEQIFTENYVEGLYGYALAEKNGTITGVAGSQSSLEKPDAIKDISRGIYSGTIDYGKFEIPISHMVYIGDSGTDKRAFWTIRHQKNPGLAVCVFDPNNNLSYQKAKKMQREVPGLMKAERDFRPGSKLDDILNKFFLSLTA